MKIDPRANASIVPRFQELAGDDLEIRQLNHRTFSVRYGGSLMHIVKTGRDINQSHHQDFVVLTSRSEVIFLRSVNWVEWEEQRYGVIDVLFESRFATVDEIFRVAKIMFADMSPGIKFFHPPKVKFALDLIRAAYMCHEPIQFPNKDLKRYQQRLWDLVSSLRVMEDVDASQGFFHGDLKYGNIIVNVDRRDRNFYVTDFDGCGISYRAMDLVSAFCQGYIEEGLLDPVKEDLETAKRHYRQMYDLVKGECGVLDAKNLKYLIVTFLYWKHIIVEPLRSPFPDAKDRIVRISKLVEKAIHTVKGF